MMVRSEPNSPLPELMVQPFTSRYLAMAHQSLPPTRSQATSAGLAILAVKLSVTQSAGCGVCAWAAVAKPSSAVTIRKVFIVLLPLNVFPAARPSSRRSALKSIHWIDLPRFAGRASPLQFHYYSFAIFQRDSQIALAQRDRVLAEHLKAPAMQGGNAIILVRRQPFNILGIGDQPGRDIGGFGAQPQQGLEQVDHGGRRLAAAALLVVVD